MKTTTKNLWAPITWTSRSKPWVCWECVRTTRREAKDEFLRDIPTKYHKDFLKNVRFAKVTITEQ